MSASGQHTSKNFFLRLDPWHRIIISFIPSILVYFFIRNDHLKLVLIINILWDVFSFTYAVTSWIVLVTRSKADMITQANKDDGSRLFVLISVIITSFAGIFTVFLLMLSSDNMGSSKTILFPIALVGIMLSWILVHTLFTFHYAHMYYSDYDKKKDQQPDLLFPGDKDPDYIDFAYFSFVIGMTFQVSDVNIASTKIRRTALAHGLLAFALNTFVVALTINLIAGLRK